MRTIENLLKEVANSTEGVKHYGRGAKAYANIESPVYPRIWILLVNPIDIVHKNSLITSSYEVVAEISSLSSFTNDISNEEQETEKYLNTMEQLQSIYHKYITNLNKDSRNRFEIGRVSRREILHEYDDNICGYVFTFTMQINESIVYQCPS
jgi:hypothetical protein